MEKLKTLLIVVLAAACGWLAWKSGCGLCRPAGETVTVVVARADIQPGTVLDETMLDTRTLPRAYAQAGAYEVKSMTDIRLATGQKAAVRIPKGDQVTGNCLLSEFKADASKAKDKKELSQAAYLEGVKYFQNSNYEKAKASWAEAVRLNPKNDDARAGLKRVAAITGGK